MTASSSVASLPIDASAVPGMRPVRDPGRMERERRDPHPAPAHEVAGDVVDDLVGVDVRVVVRRRDRERVVVELARHERADDEVPRRERLVDRRRLVDAPGDRLEVGDVEGVRPEVAVPADDVERVVRVVVGRQPAAHLDVDPEVAFVRPGGDLVGQPDVALRVRGVLEQLAVVVAVALRRLDLGRALEVEHPLVAARRRGRAARSSRSGGRGSRPGRSGSARRRCRGGPRPRGRRASRRPRRSGRRSTRASRSAGRTTPITTSLLKNSGIRPVTASPCGSTPGRVDQAMVVVAVVGLLECDRRAPARSGASASAASRGTAASCGP